MWDLIVSVPDHCLSFYFSISRPDDLLMIENVLFEQMVDRIFPADLQLNKGHSSDTEAPFCI